MVEAFDLAREKSLLINTWLSLFPDRPIIAASGISGFGKIISSGQEDWEDFISAGMRKASPVRK